MRKLWLASAAIILSTGVAMAQTSPTTPAPTGAPNAPAMTAPGMSPGNAGSTSTGTTAAQPAMTPGSMSSNASSPAPTGAPNAPVMTAPGASPGNTAPATSEPAMKTSSSTSMGASMGMNHHTAMAHSAMAMPADASAGQYLHIAKMAIMHHDKMTADEALNRAETRMLDRAVPQGGIASDDSPAISSIEHARTALGAGNMMQASTDTEMAMHQAHETGGMGMMGGMASPASSGAGMTPPDQGGTSQSSGTPGTGPQGGPDNGPGTFGGPTVMPNANK